MLGLDNVCIFGLLVAQACLRELCWVLFVEIAFRDNLVKAERRRIQRKMRQHKRLHSVLANRHGWEVLRWRCSLYCEFRISSFSCAVMMLKLKMWCESSKPFTFCFLDSTSEADMWCSTAISVTSFKTTKMRFRLNMIRVPF